MQSNKPNDEQISVASFFSIILFSFYTIVLMVEISGIFENDTILLNTGNTFGKYTPAVVIGTYIIAFICLWISLTKKHFEAGIITVNAILGIIILIIYFGSLFGVFKAFTHLYGTNKMIYVFYFGPAVLSVILAAYEFYLKIYLVYFKRDKKNKSKSLK